MVKNLFNIIDVNGKETGQLGIKDAMKHIILNQKNIKEIEIVDKGSIFKNCVTLSNENLPTINFSKIGLLLRNIDAIHAGIRSNQYSQDGKIDNFNNYRIVECICDSYLSDPKKDKLLSMSCMGITDQKTAEKLVAVFPKGFASTDEDFELLDGMRSSTREFSVVVPMNKNAVKILESNLNINFDHVRKNFHGSIIETKDKDLEIS